MSTGSNGSYPVVGDGDGDEPAAEAFAALWRRWDGLPPPTERRPWLFGVARNVILNHERSTVRQQRVATKLTPAARPAEAEDPAADDGGRLWSALAALSADDRDLLIMRAWDQMPVSEMAAVLDCSPNAVSLRLHKARARLRSQLEEKDHGPAGDDVMSPTGRGASDDRTR